MRQTTIRSFNLDWEVAHALRYKKKNQSAYVNRVLREKLLDGFAPVSIADVSEVALSCFLRDRTNDEKLKRQLQDHIDYLTSLNRDEIGRAHV